MKPISFKKVLSMLSLLVVFNFLAFAVLPISVLAAIPPLTTAQRCENFKKQFNLTSNGSNVVGDLPAYCSATELILKAINYALAFAGTIAILFLIVGGFWYLTSAGNEEQTEKGKKTIINAVIGLVVIILSATMVRIISGTLVAGK